MENLPLMDGTDERELSEKEKKEVRGKVGELLWISLMTRPDLSFDLNVTSSELGNSTVLTAKNVNKLVTKAKTIRNTLRFVHLGDIQN